MSSLSHIGDWLDALLSYTPFSLSLPANLMQTASHGIEALFVFLGVFRRVWDTDIPVGALSPRSRVFVEACVRRGVPVYVLFAGHRATSHMGVCVEGRTISFDGLPSMEDFGLPPTAPLNRKTHIKKQLRALGVPTAKSKTFFFWQLQRAKKYAATLVRVVVKPDAGTMDRHVTVDVAQNAFEAAFARARRFGPRIVVEAYVPHTVYRLTVVGGDAVFAVAYEAPTVLGDGMHTVEELVALENANPARGAMGDSTRGLHRLVLAEETDELLRTQHLTRGDIPQSGQRVRVRKDPFVRNGSSFKDVTAQMHEEVADMARHIARSLHSLIVGIDCIAENISLPLSAQELVVLECNPVPFIELHAEGSVPTAIGDALVEAMLKVASTARR